MTRKHLQWNDKRPTLLRAIGRSGVEYRIEQTKAGCWMLTRFSSPDDPGVQVSSGWLVDMKSLAEAQEADGIGPALPAQRITWTRIKSGHYWGVAPVGLAYRITKIGIVEGAAVWRLEQLPNEDSEIGTFLDEGPLQSLKRGAEQDATRAARETSLEAA